jgi:threonine dehydratase
MRVNPPERDELELARELLAEVLVRTPLVPLHGHDGILLKPEIHQVAGSFKIRGVYHAVARLSEAARARGLATVSAGNTAKALAWCGRRFGVEARSLMPDHAPQTKIDSVREMGATPVLVPVAEVFRFLREHLWEQEPYAFIHPWTCRDVMIGHGTMGLEILAQCPDVRNVFIPVGGGGLLAGVASALLAARPALRVIAVEPRGCPALHTALQTGHPVNVECDTICDGVAVPYITDEMFPLLSELAREVVLVEEREVREAVRQIAAAAHVIAEPSGALAFAAAWKTRPSGKSVCLVTGGSIDPEKLAAILTEV